MMTKNNPSKYKSSWNNKGQFLLRGVFAITQDAFSEANTFGSILQTENHKNLNSHPHSKSKRHGNPPLKTLTENLLFIYDQGRETTTIPP